MSGSSQIMDELTILRTHTLTTFTLGVDTLTPANDGGLHIVLFDGVGHYDWPHGRNQALPVLSMEALNYLTLLMASRSERNILFVTMREL